ncbi:MAG: 50S ribosomal protein L3 [Candidatus Marinimicrobia bacterium]|nr:50S ribosomal protein L3 [Candidatus Neomarinimicrobiota bacterium]
MTQSMILGRKIGMTRIFNEQGRDIPVTVISAGPCVVTQVKTVDRDGYNAVQLGFEDLKEKHTLKPRAGLFKKLNVTPKRVIREYAVEGEANVAEGDVLTVELFTVGEKVDVRGVSKGKGFTGVMKRHGFSGGRRSHGKNSVMRAGGSIGASADPARVFPGTRMPGRSGGKNVCVKKLTVVRIDSESNQLFVRGAIPGCKNGIISITK